MRLGHDVLARLPVALAHEWFLPDGFGGWCAGTAAGIPARPDHGCLLSFDPATPALLRLDERVVTPGGAFELFARGDAAAEGARRGGHQWLDSFALDPWPVWRWRIGDHVLERRLRGIYEHVAVALSWRLVEGPPLTLTVSPAVAPPERSGDEAPVLQAMVGRVRLEFGSAGTSLTLWHNGVFLPARAWTGDAEGESGDAPRTFLPGYFEVPLAPGEAFHLVAAAEPQLFRTLASEDRLGREPPRSLADCVTAIETDERERLTEWSATALEGALATARQGAEARRAVHEDDPGWRARTLSLVRLLEHGLARRGLRRVMFGGMPDLERGTTGVRAVGGLIAIRSFDDARAILAGLLEFASEGLIPESFDPDGTPGYGDPEPTLWLAVLIERWARRSGRYEEVHDLYPVLEEQIRYFRSGREGVRVDDDGLLEIGSGDDAFKPAALNALWYYADVALSQLARHAGRKESAAFHLAWARDQQKRFVERFWDEASGCLFEGLRGLDPVRAIGPDQLWAASLTPPLLPEAEARTLVDTVERELVTPFGLRERPGQATARPEWLGPFVAAELRARGRESAALTRARGRLDSLFQGLEADGFATIPDVVALDDPALGLAVPPAPGAHLVSPLAAAELLRAWVEELAPESAGVAAARES